MTLTLRLDAETERALARLVRESGNTRSEVVRQAIARLITDDRRRKRDSPYRLMQDLVGCARGGPPDLSKRTGTQFRRLLASRAQDQKR